MDYQLVVLLSLQITGIWTAPLNIIQAQPQVMMHNLQQPSPIETLQSLKAQKINQDLQTSAKLQQMMITNMQQQITTNTLQELAKIQAFQYATQSPVEMHPLDLMQSWLPQMQTPIDSPWPQPEEQQDMPPQYIPEEQHAVMPVIQQMSEDAMQEIALQQQMLALQQMQGFSQLNKVQSPYTLAQPEPMLILLPDVEINNSDNGLFKNEHNEEYLNEDADSITVESNNDTHAEVPKGTRKAILLIPNARFSIGGIISQIPWLPIEVNVPDTAIWAWNGIYNGISSIISIIGSRLPWRPRPEVAAASEPSVKAFLKQLQRNNYMQALPVY
ncbi:hypothetical protein O0L34_g14279 [Tuta absoluta]|nr:hypothetical protein O0L34_g14278 [Tuta absoluta]KAJ2939569.1 hypothetical protein O0L34_g14279 [Tuta absoluta]